MPGGLLTAPIAEAQLAETVLLNHVTFPTAVATEAAGACWPPAVRNWSTSHSAAPRESTQGLAVARASAIAGFTATSNAATARRYQLAAASTMAHSFHRGVRR